MVSISLFCDFNMADVTSCEDTLYEIDFLKSPTSFTRGWGYRVKKEVWFSRWGKGQPPIWGILVEKKDGFLPVLVTNEVSILVILP